jgi:hypothetical protein
VRSDVAAVGVGEEAWEKGVTVEEEEDSGAGEGRSEEEDDEKAGSADDEGIGKLCPSAGSRTGSSEVGSSVHWGKSMHFHTMSPAADSCARKTGYFVCENVVSGSSSGDGREKGGDGKRPHSRATLIAVSGLSPVIISVRMPAAVRREIAAGVLGLSRFSITKKPRNLRSHSTSLRGRCYTAP